MPTESIELSLLITASPERIFEAWLNSSEHTVMTGVFASIDANPGGTFSASNGYITGRTLQVEPGRRIIQSWRTTKFPEDAEDSLLEIILTESKEGTELTLLHSQIPVSQSGQYSEGWIQYYFTPMKTYFEEQASQAEPRPTTATTVVVAPAKLVAMVSPPEARSTRVVTNAKGNVAPKQKPVKKVANAVKKNAVKKTARKGVAKSMKKTPKKAGKKVAKKVIKKMAAKKRSVAKRPARWHAQTNRRPPPRKPIRGR